MSTLQALKCCSIKICLCGAQYITGNISPYIKSYLNQVNGQFEHNCSKMQIYLLLPGIIVIMTFIFPLGSFLSNYLNPRIQLIIGACIGIMLIAASSFMVSFWPFFLCYCFGFAINNGIGYGVPLYNSWKHFPERKGLVTGIVLCGYGLGSFFFGLIAKHLINPDHIEPDQLTDEYPWEVAQNVPKALQVLSATFALISILSIILTFPPPNPNQTYIDIDKGGQSVPMKEDLPPFSMITSIQPSQKVSIISTRSAFPGINKEQQSTLDGEAATYKSSSHSSGEDVAEHFRDGQRINSSKDKFHKICLIDELSQMTKDFKMQRGSSNLVNCLLSRQFILLYLMNSCSIFIAFFIAGTFKEYTKETLRDDDFISMIGAISGIFGGIRFHWGPFIDWFGYKMVYGAILLLQIVIGFTFPIFGALYKLSFATYLFLIFFTEGGHFTLVPIMITRMFGDQATMVYGIGFSFSGFSSLITSLLVTFVFYDNFEACYYLGGALCVVSLFILIFFFKEQKFA